AGEPSREISSQEAAEAFRQGIPFLDARRTEDYQAGHIRGALAMPVWEADMDERLTRFDASGHPLKSPVVLYCSGGDCQDSELLASKLVALGYRHLLIYRGGYPDWATKGRPIHRGAQP
ncbi:MAG: rhodanese y domain superfamily protein, partial [Holophagaceae bacterium]|nr:rhodanese y domain superfamily protein [Holophagaceae bacterium]